MTDIVELMQKRMVLIEKLAALNSKQLQNTQIRSGIEVELLTCIERIERDGESEAALQKCAELQGCLEAAVDACTACERELDQHAEQLNTLDRQAGPAP